jgi:diacylglycerol kinase family enzyme
MSHPADRRRIAVVVNPAAGPRIRDRVRQLRDVLRRHVASVEFDWYETTARDPGTELTRRAVARGAEIVVACGGDGTVMACAAALVGSTVPLALVPSGTGNIVATSLGIPSRPASAVSVALGPGRAHVDVCVGADGRPFFAGSAGVSASIMRTSSSVLKSRFGMLAYAISAAQHLFDGSAQYRVTLGDGTELIRWADAVLVGNYAGMVRREHLTWRAPDDGAIEVGFLRLRPLHRWLLASRAPATRRPLEWHQTTRGVVVAATCGDTPVERDGDWYGQCADLSVIVVPRALTVCVPPGPLTPAARTLASLAARDLPLLAIGLITTRRSRPGPARSRGREDPRQ